MMTGNEIRNKFLEFFKTKGHTIVASDSLVPKDDPTVLFTTAGMQQFKLNFLGVDKSLQRAASCQKCLRTDDLDRVGKTPVHHTFFEMLGNFSFGDYFKKEAIAWAWEFFTKELNLPEDKLWVSVYKDDEEAYNIWLKDIRLPANRIVKLGDKSNFWPSNAKQDGPNGPCGPCSEIFYDFDVNPDCPNGDKCDPDCNCGRFAEIWNLVFTQFNRKEGGVLEPLPSKNIDTGMGLERLVAVMQGKKNNYESDLFTPIIAEIDRETQRNKYSVDLIDKRIIADHIRAIVFAISDGVIPSNEGRGYVVKKLIIDATDRMIPIGQPAIRLYALVPQVVDIMKNTYRELLNKNKVDQITEIIRRVQEAFLVTRNEKIPELKKEIQNIAHSNIPVESKVEQIGKIGFLYRDTYGLTIPTIVGTSGDCINAVTSITNDVKKFILSETSKEINKHMEQQREKSRAGSKMTGDVFAKADLDLNVPKTEFLGYTAFSGEGKILRLFRGNENVAEARQGDEVKVILDRTPFYAESGGQIGDTGVMTTATGKIRITGTQKVADIFIHSGVVEEGSVKNGEKVKPHIDQQRRLSIMRNHTATHLLQAALRKVLGSHVQQQGSLVAEDRLRFDFTHPSAITREQIRQIEDFVNGCVLACDAVNKEVLPLEEARKRGALAFFAEKYGETVRVVSIDGYSKEFCGGTHLEATGQIGLFKITGESAIAQGIRRLEAKTGTGALELVNSQESQLDEIAQTVKSSRDEAAGRIKQQAERLKQLEKELEQYRFETVKAKIDGILEKAETFNGTKVITHTFQDTDMNTLRRISDLIKQKAQSSVAILGGRSADNAYLLASVTDNLVKEGIKADELINAVASLINGKGGGRPQMAQAGSKEPQNVEQAVSKARELLRQKIGQR